MASLAEKIARLRPLAPADDTRRNEIERLRERIAAMLERPLDTPRRARRELPFEPREGPEGRFHLLERVLSLAERFGGVALDEALTVDVALLALLALTPALAGCRPERAVFLDLETSGLGGGTGNVPFLAGLCFFDGRRFVLEQLLLREPSEERALLAHLHARMADAELCVSFNGKSFDLPVLRARAVMNRLPPLPERPQLDLLHLARRVHRHRRWRKSLVVLERSVLGHDRGPDVAGCEVGARYHHFLRTGDEAGLAAVVEHNASDVLAMVALMAVYGAPLRSSGSWLPAEELASMARVMRRAGGLDEALRMAERAVAEGAGAPGLCARAEIAKALGDRAQALRDFERVAASESDPKVRLELAKLYEHHARRPELALAMVEGGTTEKPEAEARRRARLARKIQVCRRNRA